MSQTGPGVAGLPLFAPAALAPADAGPRDAAEERHAAFLERVRHLVAGHYAGTGITVTADDVHRIMDQYRIGLPEGASPNCLGTFFSGWNRARSTGHMVRSKRAGSNGNPLLQWIIE